MLDLIPETQRLIEYGFLMLIVSVLAIMLAALLMSQLKLFEFKPRYDE